MDPKNKKKAEKLISFAENAELAIFEEIQGIGDTLEKISGKKDPEVSIPETIKVKIDGINAITLKGDPGEKGDSGEMPSDEHIKEIVKNLIPDPIPGPKGENSTIPGPKGDKGDKPIPGIDFDFPKDGKDGNDGKDGSPDTAEQIIEKINGLPVDEDEYKIDISHLKGIESIRNDIKALYERNLGGGAVTGKGHIKNYDLSDQLDGVKNTFNLPANWTIISVVSSSFPSAFRPVIDYTFTTTSITFTSQIQPSSTLASGQTLIVVYEES